MELTVHLTDVMAPYEPQRTDDGHTTTRITIEPEKTIADVAGILGLATYAIEYERYYSVRDPNFLEGYLPYLIVGNSVRWMVPVQEAAISAFLTTTRVTTDDLYIQHGWPATGGFGPADIQALWEHVYAVLTYISPILAPIGVLGGIAGVIGRIRGIRQSPGWVFSLVASRPRWNPVDLAELTQWPPERAKDLLAVCCYEYDPYIQMYAKTAASDRFFNELKQRKWPMVPGTPYNRSHP